MTFFLILVCVHSSFSLPKNVKLKAVFFLAVAPAPAAAAGGSCWFLLMLLLPFPLCVFCLYYIFLFLQFCLYVLLSKILVVYGCYCFYTPFGHSVVGGWLAETRSSIECHNGSRLFLDG